MQDLPFARCEFCEHCKPDHTCLYEGLWGSRESACKKAIKRMSEAVKTRPELLREILRKG